MNPYFGKDFSKSSRWFAKSRGRVQRHPDYLCTAVGVSEKSGHICKFVDGQAREVDFEETRKLVESFRPDLVVIQATTPSIYSDLSYARLAKEINRNAVTVMVGAHASAEPEDTLLKGKGFLDIVARGEYDYTLLDIAGSPDFSITGGISYLKEGKVINNPARPFIDNLDSLPFPAWQHINICDYHDAGKLYPFITLLAGRGCEGACTFCLFPQAMYGRHYRARSKESIIAEIEYDLKLFPGLKEIMFEDDTFTLKHYHSRLAGICEELIRKKYKVSWSCNARADLDDIEILKLMKKSGCRMLCVGFEFGNQKILNSVHKGVTLEQMNKFASLAHKAGIRVHGCFMVGGPGETLDTARETIKFAKSLPIDTVQFSGVCAYPGTEFYRWCKERDYLVASDWPDWVDSKLEQRTIVNFPGLSSRKIDGFVDRGLKEFYLRPKQIWKIFTHIDTVSDFTTKIYGLGSFIKYFKEKHKK